MTHECLGKGISWGSILRVASTEQKYQLICNIAYAYCNGHGNNILGLLLSTLLLNTYVAR